MVGHVAVCVVVFVCDDHDIAPVRPSGAWSSIARARRTPAKTSIQRLRIRKSRPWRSERDERRRRRASAASARRCVPWRRRASPASPPTARSRRTPSDEHDERVTERVHRRQYHGPTPVSCAPVMSVSAAMWSQSMPCRKPRAQRGDDEADLETGRCPITATVTSRPAYSVTAASATGLPATSTAERAAHRHPAPGPRSGRREAIRRTPAQITASPT